MQLLNTGCVKSTGTTFGGFADPPSDLTKKILNAKRKILVPLYTGCVKSTGTTFGGCSEPHSDLTKNLLNAERKIFNKFSYDYKIYFLRNQI